MGDRTSLRGQNAKGARRMQVIAGLLCLLAKAEVAHVASEVATEPEIETTRPLEREMERVKLATRLS